MIPPDDPLTRVVHGEEGPPTVAPPDRTDVLARGHRILVRQTLAVLFIVMASAAVLIAISVGARDPVRTRLLSSPTPTSEVRPVASFDCTPTSPTSPSTSRPSTSSSPTSPSTSPTSTSPSATSTQTSGTRRQSPSAALTVSCRDTSNGRIGQRSWDFGDKGTSTTKNPTHTYATAGSYTVTLLVTGPGGTNTTSQMITVPPTPTSTSKPTPPNQPTPPYPTTSSQPR
jgi:hypothetical protein